MRGAAGAACLWFIASEGMSVLENAAAMGIPIQKVLLQALELFKRKGGADDHPPDVYHGDYEDDEENDE